MSVWKAQNQLPAIGRAKIKEIRQSGWSWKNLIQSSANMSFLKKRSSRSCLNYRSPSATYFLGDALFLRRSSRLSPSLSSHWWSGLHWFSSPLRAEWRGIGFKNSPLSMRPFESPRQTPTIAPIFTRSIPSQLPLDLHSSPLEKKKRHPIQTPTVKRAIGKSKQTGKKKILLKMGAFSIL